MGIVLIRCPTTDAYVQTGVMMDFVTFFETDIGARELLCPDCGKVHRWAQHNAWLKERPEHE
jgi:hypothetical protein